MAVFARPAVWSYDLPLFRQAIVEELELEGLLAAIALQDEAVWVVEADEQPVAFAWGRRQGSELRLVRFYVAPHPAAVEIGRSLLARITGDHGGSSADLAVIERTLVALGASLTTGGYERNVTRGGQAA